MFLRPILRYHWIGLVFAILVAGIMVAPELIMRSSLGDSFQGIYMHGSDAELFYLARMQQTYRGISAWDSPFLYEYRGEFPLTYALFSDAILGYPGKWLGIPVQKLNLIYKTLFSAATFLLIYSLIFRLTGNKLWSVAGAIFTMVGYRLITFPGMMDFLFWRHNHSQFLLFSRPPTSQATWIVFWSFLHVLLSALRRREWKYFIGCGILFGLSFYIQYFAWTFLAALTGIVMVGAVLLKQFKLSAKVSAIFCIGVVIGLPYILNILAIMRHEFFDFYGHMTLLVYSRETDISKMGIALSLLFLWYLKRSKNKNIDDIFMLAILGTTFLTTNQQVITKRLLEVGHYHWFFNVFLYILIFLYLVYKFIPRMDQKWLKIFSGIIIISSFLCGYLIQSSSYTAQYQRAASVQKYVPVFEWLNRNTSPDDVVYGSSNYLSLLLSVYTKNFSYWHPTSPLYMMPPKRFETALFTELKLTGISPSMLGGESFFHPNATPEQLDIASKYSGVSSMLAIQYRQAFQDGMFKRYEFFYEQKWNENFKKYRLDYVIYDPADSNWNLKQIKFLKPIQKFGNIIIYENTLR